MTCSHRRIFVCFVSVTGSSVALKYSHLQSRVQQVFSKKFPAFPHSDGTVPEIISGLAIRELSEKRSHRGSGSSRHDEDTEILLGPKTVRSIILLYFEQGGKYGQACTNRDTHRANWQYPKTR